MTASEPLALYADLYRDFPECVPYEWTFNPADEYEVACVETEDVCLFFDVDSRHPWFLNLARQSVENRLEAGGWDQNAKCGADNKIIGYWWDHVADGIYRYSAEWPCPHAAACAAYRAMKEQA